MRLSKRPGRKLINYGNHASGNVTTFNASSGFLNNQRFIIGKMAKDELRAAGFALINVFQYFLFIPVIFLKFLDFILCIHLFALPFEL
jgi:hypothetical protein